MKIRRLLEHTYLEDRIVTGGWVVDAGANHGGFARDLASRHGVRCVGYEPDPGLFRALPSAPGVDWKPLAITGDGKPVRLLLGENQCSSIVFEETAGARGTVVVESITLGDALNGLEGEIELLKLDIEGAELDVLMGVPESQITRVKQVTVEFHDFMDRTQLPRILACCERMHRLGFHVLKLSHFTYGDVLFLNRRYAAPGVLGRAWLVARVRYLGGLERRWNRLTKLLFGQGRRP